MLWWTIIAVFFPFIAYIIVKIYIREAKENSNQIQQLGIFLFILFKIYKKKAQQRILICCKSNSINHILLQDLLSDKGI